MDVSACAELPSLTPHVLPLSSLFCPPIPRNAETFWRFCHFWIQFRIVMMNTHVAYTWLLCYKARPQIILVVAQYRALKKVAANASQCCPGGQCHRPSLSCTDHFLTHCPEILLLFITLVFNTCYPLFPPINLKPLPGPQV